MSGEETTNPTPPRQDTQFWVHSDHREYQCETAEVFYTALGRSKRGHMWLVRLREPEASHNKPQ